MVGIVAFALIGIVAGGILGGELADLGAPHKGDIGRLLIGGLFGASAGAVGGGYLGLWLSRKSTDRQE